MSTALAVTSPVHNLDDLQKVARLLAVSGYFDAKGTTEQAIAQLATKILAGQEMGYGPFVSVQGIHVIQGKPTMSANLMAAAVKASPRYDFRVKEMSDTAVNVEFFERVNGKLESLGESRFTMEDARKADTKNPNLSKYPRNMLYARAISNGVRWFCPDVFMGNAVYTPDEMGATVDGEGNVVDVPVQPAPPALGVTNGTPAPKDEPKADNPFTDPPEWVQDLIEMESIVYGENSGTEAELCTGVSGGKCSQFDCLTQAQADKLMTAMRKKLKESTQQPATVDMESTPELAH